MTNYTPEAKFWFSILDTVLKIPGAKIDRKEFLEKVYEKTACVYHILITGFFAVLLQ